MTAHALHHHHRHHRGGRGRCRLIAEDTSESPFRGWLLMTGRHRGPRGFGPGGPFGPGGFGPGGPFGGRKRSRGDIRAAILALLAEAPMHGYQIMRELTERSEGAWRPSPGSVYPTLQQLEDEGLVQPQESEAGKRVFALTAAGRELAGQAPGRKPWEEAAAEADDDAGAIRDLVFQVLAATRQVVHAGTPEQVAAARTLLKETRRSLYRLLAEDEEPVDREGGAVA